MLSITAVFKELLNDDISPALKELCHKFFQEKTLYWENNLKPGLWVLRNSSKETCADIVQEDFDLGVYHATCCHSSKPFDQNKFNRFEDAIKFVSFEFMKAGFIVLPPDFEI